MKTFLRPMIPPGVLFSLFMLSFSVSLLAQIPFQAGTVYFSNGTSETGKTAIVNAHDMVIQSSEGKKTHYSAAKVEKVRLDNGAFFLVHNIKGQKARFLDLVVDGPVQLYRLYGPGNRTLFLRRGDSLRALDKASFKLQLQKAFADCDTVKQHLVFQPLRYHAKEIGRMVNAYNDCGNVQAMDQSISVPKFRSQLTFTFGPSLDKVVRAVPESALFNINDVIRPAVGFQPGLGLRFLNLSRLKAGVEIRYIRHASRIVDWPYNSNEYPISGRFREQKLHVGGFLEYALYQNASSRFYALAGFSYQSILTSDWTLAYPDNAPDNLPTIGPRFWQQSRVQYGFQGGLGYRVLIPNMPPVRAELRLGEVYSSFRGNSVALDHQSLVLLFGIDL
ncbi:MAG: hypothetical protein AAF206_24310 [Bacteroidota bacterium]